MSHLFFEAQKCFCSFQLLENGHIHNFDSKLINVMKLDVENNNIASTLSNIANINVEIDNVDLTLFNVDMHNVFLTLINIAQRRTSHHRNNNGETTLKCFQGIEECC